MRGIKALRKMKTYCAIIAVSLLTSFALMSLGVSFSRDVIFYFGSALIQSYAAIVTLPITLAAVHLQGRYGLVAVRTLFERVKKVFVVLAVQFSFGFLLMSQVDVIGSFDAPLHVGYLAYSTLLLLALLPLPFAFNVVREVFTLKPSDILDHMLRGSEPSKFLDPGNSTEAEELLERVFFLLGVCIRDQALRVDLRWVASRVERFLSDLATEMGKLDVKVGDYRREKAREVILRALASYGTYVVENLLFTSQTVPLPEHESVSMIVKGISDLLRAAIERGWIGVGREYYYYARMLEKVLSIYIEYERIYDAIEIYLSSLSKVIHAGDAILDLEKIQSRIIKDPKNYSNSLPRWYDFYVDYATSVAYTLFEVLNEEHFSGYASRIGNTLEIRVFPWLLEYPTLLMSYYIGASFGSRVQRGLFDPIVSVALKDENYAPRLLANILAWLARALVLAKDYLTDDDSDQVRRNIRNFISSIRGILIHLLKQHGNVIEIVAYLDGSHTKDVRLRLATRSASVSGAFYSRDGLGQITRRYDLDELCKLLHELDLGFDVLCP